MTHGNSLRKTEAPPKLENVLQPASAELPWMAEEHTNGLVYSQFWEAGHRNRTVEPWELCPTLPQSYWAT